MLLPETLKYLRLPLLRSLSCDLVFPSTGRGVRFRAFRSAENADSLIGMTVGAKYYVFQRLGTGGMSVVYKARTLRKNRPMAVKTLRTQGLSDDVIVKRFRREAELLSHLNHPRIVQVHDYGYTKRGQPYFVMDYLVGRNLNQVIREDGPIEPERARHIFSQVCGAVDHAHRCGVIHRDLKPGNIMLLDIEGEQDFVKVVDFGIARFQSETNRLTRLGEVWGSPVYMSPEQCMGKPLDARSDVYSLGISMYEALTGEVPFLGSGYVDTMTMQINDPPKPFRVINPDVHVPQSLETVVMRALRKDPHDRHQSMAELRDEIEDAFAQEPQSFKISRSRVAAASVATTLEPTPPLTAIVTQHRLKAVPSRELLSATASYVRVNVMQVVFAGFALILILIGCFAYGWSTGGGSHPVAPQDDTNLQAPTLPEKSHGSSARASAHR